MLIKPNLMWGHDVIMGFGGVIDRDSLNKAVQWVVDNHAYSPLPEGCKVYYKWHVVYYLNTDRWEGRVGGYCLPDIVVALTKGAEHET